MEKNLTKYDSIVSKKISENTRSKEVKCVKINGERIILKIIMDSTKRRKGKKRINRIERYFSEKEIYLKLKDEDFLPKLKYFDDNNLILGLSDVGDSFEIYKNINKKIYNESVNKFNKEIKKIIDVLFDKYGLYHNDLEDKNICIDKNNKIRIIDFDQCSTNLKGAKKKYKIFEKIKL
tara:strand:+ start:1843 stop:2376 length:534 start_codon:yes stop_codon:yes gene_type:complete